jgi:hypothetical protein
MTIRNLLFIAAIAILSFFHPHRCHGADLADVVHVYGGVNGVWFQGPTTNFPRDLEAGGTASASLSPHISVVSALFYGFDQAYWRWGVGPRITVTDVDDKNFSVGLGASFRGGSQPSILPREWTAEATFGWVPVASLTRLVVIGEGGYGLTTSKGSALLGLRWKFPL